MKRLIDIINTEGYEDTISKNSSMRKNIDIPDDIVKDLKKMAIDADKDLKNFIQDHLIDLVRRQKEQKTPTKPRPKDSDSNGS